MSRAASLKAWRVRKRMRESRIDLGGPYIGLVDGKGSELKVKGYQRLDMSKFLFRISRRGTFSAISEVVFGPFAKAPKPQPAFFALWETMADTEPFARVGLGAKTIHAGESLALMPVQFDIYNLPFATYDKSTKTLLPQVEWTK